MKLLIRNHFVGTGFQRVFKHGIGISHRRRVFDIADSFKVKGHRAALAQSAAALAENRSDIAGRAVAVVGQRFDDDCDLAGAEAFVTHGYVIVAAGGLSGLGNGALNIVFRHAFGTSRLDGQTQARVFVRFGQTALGGNGNVTGQLCKHLGLFGVLRPFAIHNIFKLGMSRHCKISYNISLCFFR